MKTLYKGLLIKRLNNNLEFMKLSIKRKGALKQLYKNIKCERIDIQERKIKNKIFDFIFNDEFLLDGTTDKPENIIAFTTYEGKIAEVIYGNLFICGKADKNGAETDLTEGDINKILKSLVYITHTPTNTQYLVLKYDI